MKQVIISLLATLTILMASLFLCSFGGQIYHTPSC